VQLHSPPTSAPPRSPYHSINITTSRHLFNRLFIWRSL